MASKKASASAKSPSRAKSSAKKAAAPASAPARSGKFHGFAVYNRTSRSVEAVHDSFSAKENKESAEAHAARLLGKQGEAANLDVIVVELNEV